MQTLSLSKKLVTQFANGKWENVMCTRSYHERWEVGQFFNIERPVRGHMLISCLAAKNNKRPQVRIKRFYKTELWLFSFPLTKLQNNIIYMYLYIEIDIEREREGEYGER